MAHNKELSHFGILGMHWGTRKGPDTSSSDHKTTSTFRKKKLNELSNAEIRTAIDRINLEKQYKKLTTKEKGFGRKLAEDMAGDMAKETLKEAAKAYGPKLIRFAMQLALRRKNKGLSYS